MKNILLILADIRGANEYGRGEFGFGVAALAAQLKKEGHSVRLFHVLSDHPREEFLSSIDFASTDLIGISYLSCSSDIVHKWPAWIKAAKNVPIVVGGIHPTLNPDEVMAVEDVDMLLMGEADLSFPMLLKAIEGKMDFGQVPMLWRKEDGRIVKNVERAVVQNLDELPFLDTEIFDFDSLLSSKGRLPYLPYTTSRGCPFDCSYCSNHYLMRLHPPKHRYLRRQGVDRALAELKMILDRHPHIKTISFLDDMFNFENEWLREFALKYPAAIGLPYRVLVRIDALTEEQAGLLRRSGCFRATFGIESGSPKIRYQVMNRKMPNEAILRGIGYLQRNGIQTVSYNMVGFPDETNMDMLETIKFNAVCGIDAAFCSIFQPHAGTRLYDVCRERGYLTGKSYRSVYEGSTLRYPGISEVDIKYAHRVFRVLIGLYGAIHGLPRALSAPLEFLLDLNVHFPQAVKKVFIGIHDKWFDGLILDRKYRLLEKELVKSGSWKEIKK